MKHIQAFIHCKTVTAERQNNLYGLVYTVRHNYRTPKRQLAKLCYYTIFGTKIPTTKHEIMLHALSH